MIKEQLFIKEIIHILKNMIDVYDYIIRIKNFNFYMKSKKKKIYKKTKNKNLFFKSHPILRNIANSTLT